MQYGHINAFYEDCVLKCRRMPMLYASCL